MVGRAGGVTRSPAPAIELARRPPAWLLGYAAVRPEEPSRVANIKQQIKRNRRALKQHETNLRYRSTIKTLYKRLDVAVSAGEGDADERSRGLVRLIDRAAARGVIHKNSAARKKRRIARLMNRASETSGAAT